MYSRVTDINRHNESINCLEFSDDGAYLASADDAGLLVITNVVKGEERTHFEFPDSVTALLWVPRSGNLFVGLANCELHFVSLPEDKTYSADLRPEGYTHLQARWKDLIQINSLCYNARRNILAVGVGYNVIILTIGEMDSYHQNTSISPFQTVQDAFMALDFDALDAIGGLPGEVRSIQFVEGGEGLVITYLEEGIRCYDLESETERWHLEPKSSRIGRSAIDPQEKYLICSNLNNGFDLYDLRRRAHIREVPHRPINEELNVPLPALFMNSESILLGSSCGEVMVAASTAVPGRPLILDHGSDIVQALAFVETSQTLSYLATGIAEKGPQTYVRIWRKDQDAALPQQRVMVSKSVSTIPEEASSVDRPLVLPKAPSIDPRETSDIGEPPATLNGPGVDKTSTARGPTMLEVNHAESLAETPARRRRMQPRADKTRRNSEDAAKPAVEANPPSSFRTFLSTVSSVVATFFIVIFLINALGVLTSSDDEEDTLWMEQNVDPLEASRIASSRLAEQLDRRFLHPRTSTLPPSSIAVHSNTISTAEPASNTVRANEAVA